MYVHRCDKCPLALNISMCALLNLRLLILEACIGACGMCCVICACNLQEHWEGGMFLEKK